MLQYRVPQVSQINQCCFECGNQEIGNEEPDQSFCSRFPHLIFRLLRKFKKLSVGTTLAFDRVADRHRDPNSTARRCVAKGSSVWTDSSWLASQGGMSRLCQVDPAAAESCSRRICRTVARLRRPLVSGSRPCSMDMSKSAIGPQKLSSMPGEAQLTVTGADLPSESVRVDPQS